MKPSTARVLRALQAAGDRGCTTHDLCQPDVGGVRFSGRIHELRAAGYEIDEHRIRQGSHRYTLHADARQDVGAGSGSPAGKPDVLPLTGRRLTSKDVVGPYQVCNSCGHRWDGGPWDDCPACRRDVSQVAAFWTREQAEAWVPWCAQAATERRAA